MANQSSGTRYGNEDTRNDGNRIEENGPIMNGEIISQIVLQVMCGVAIQCITKAAHVLL